ncbi:unnamed protein product [Coffea canephora]|uniref:DH200=94 genomic scaffold, scaffold_1795 n=1 Tax=Coffea canephora TaxID=49390 RepID=A0A068VJN3_COFCA|nr:unnamed protein product [Coffea canephora]
MDQNSVEQEVTRILELLMERNVSTIVLSGKSGIGKTWMARKVGLLAITNERVDIMLWISLSVRHDEMSLYEHIAHQLSLLSTSAELEIDDIGQVQNDNGKEETLDDLKEKVERDLELVLQFIQQNAYQQSIQVADGDRQQKLKVLETSRNEDMRHQTQGDKKVIGMMCQLQKSAIANLGLFSLRIKSLPRCFYYLKKLNVLVLGGCDFLQKIDEIGKLTTLTVLEVSGSCLIESIPDNFFQQMTQLRSLHFSDFQIEVLPKSFYDLTEHRWLILKGLSHLTELKSLKKCQKLMVVDLSGAASLPTFPEKNLKPLPKLQTLNLSNTKIKSLPILHETMELTHLSISDCRNMDRLPSIQSLTNLQVLDISWSAIMDFHDKSFESNRHLKILDLSGTAIPWVPFNISKPCQFYLSCCSEIKYMNCVESPKELEILDFSGACNLVKIEAKFFDCLEKLRVLNLSKTKVKDLPCLSALKNLHQLLLSGCLNLEKLPSLASRKLEELDLTDCLALTMIEDVSFQHLPRLRLLILSNAKIERLPDLNSLSNLEELNLSGVISIESVDFIEHMSKL